MIPRVLVTRSEPGAWETAARLSTLGIEPVVEPLFVLQRLDSVLPPFDAIAFTSLNGVRVFADRSSRRQGTVWCVGDRTAEAARAAGFPDVRSASGDVGALSELILKASPPGARILHVGNEDSHGDLAGKLRAAGRIADFVAAFRAIDVERPGPHLAAHLSGDAPLAAALVHSPRAGKRLASIIAGANSPPPLPVAAISQAAAHDLGTRTRRIEIAQAPTEDALLAALRRLLADR